MNSPMSFNDPSGYVRQPSNPNDFCATSPVCMNLSGNQDPNAGIASSSSSGMGVPYSSSVVVRQMIDFWAPGFIQYTFGGVFAGSNCLNCRGGINRYPGLSTVVWEFVSIVRERVVTTRVQRDVNVTESGVTDGPIDNEKNYGELIRNNSAFREDLFKRLRAEALRVIADIGKLTPGDRSRMFRDFDNILLKTDIDTLGRFATQRHMIDIGNRTAEVAEQGILRGMGKLFRRFWNAMMGAQEIYERSQFGPEDIDGWVGACNPTGVANAGHCGFYDPSNVFHDIDGMVPQIMQGHGGPP